MIEPIRTIRTNNGSDKAQTYKDRNKNDKNNLKIRFNCFVHE